MRIIPERIRAWAGRDFGATKRELRDACPPSQRTELSGHLRQMLADGQLHCITRRAGAGGGRSSIRFFTSLDKGLAWAACGDTGPRGRPVVRPIQGQTVGKAWRNLQQRPNGGEVVVPAGVKRTVCVTPSFDARYQCDPAQRIAGGFADMGVGRYLDGSAS